MNWTKFNNHGESNNHAFEVMCNLLFESWCKEIYKEELVQFAFVNGDGGDGGVEAYGILTNGDVVAVQSKWFPEKIETTQINQISNSFQTAVKVRPNIKRYVICIPRNLGSKKIVKGGSIANNTELDRWEKFVSNCKSSNPNVEIILWDETIIQERLIHPETQGVYKYWFENTVIFDNLFTHSYEKIVNGWAKLKYVPEIHTAGYIHEHLEYFLGSNELTRLRYEKMCSFIGRFKSLLRAYEGLLALGLPESTKDLKYKIQMDLPILHKWLENFECNIDTVKNGGRTNFITEDLELNCCLSDVKDSPLHFGKYFHFHEIEKLLENIDDEFLELRQLFNNDNNNKIIFLGMQGTGKTAGIVAEAANFLSNRSHLPVIIHAKDFSDGDAWASMIISSLGLQTTWNEIELFEALQNAAFLRTNDDRREFFVEPKCVIMVDGIDESASWKFWKDKINETDAFFDAFPRIKFVFLSRPYAFPERYELSYRHLFYSLPTTGDGKLDEVCDKYFSTYKIDIGDNFWIKQNLKSPVAIKLFCDIYRGQKIITLPQNTVVLTELYKAKIASLEECYGTIHTGVKSFKAIHIALVELAELFAKSSSIRFEDIYDKVSLRLKDTLNEILDFLMNEGFVYTFIKQEDDFSVPETYYSWGMQPAFDYLIAQKVYKGLNAGEVVEINNTDGIFQMLALISIENGKLITEYTNIKIENQEAFELICYALANCSVDVAGEYSEYLKKLMGYSVAEFREIFNNVMLPVLKIDKHPLGSVLLDEFLREFDNSAERDIWWSIPSYLKDSYDAEWYAYTELDFENISLENTDKYNAAPLTLAWSLSSVNNNVRQDSRFKLTAWGISQPMEFWELFKKCISINDMQILEDMFAIAYGIALEQLVCEEYLNVASHWILDNLFSMAGLNQYENVALRYYGTGIVKIAITKGLLESNKLNIVTPPYNYEPELLELYKGALDSERMGGYEAIDYDLSRYVLCDRLDCFFRTDHNTKDYHEKTKKFIDKYREKYNLSELKINGFIIAIAYQYLLKQGWNKEKFWYSSNNVNRGVDCAIRGTYYPATHGEMSQVMTIAEKNIWLAKHKIEAIFSNELPSCEDYRTFQFIEDYSQIENFINVYQDYANAINREKKHNWFNAELLAAPCFETIDKEKIESWMSEDFIPQFDKWLSNYNGNVLLSTFTNVKNDLCGVEEAIWIGSGVVKNSDFTRLLVAIEKYFEDRNEMINVSGFHAYQDCQCYCTPQEACLVHSAREINSYLLIPESDGNIEVNKLLEECLTSDELETEKYFTLPSKLARELMGIVYGDGFTYSDNKGNIIACYSSDGENWGTYQKTLIVNNDALNNGLEKMNLRLFWLFRVYREPAPKARERYEKIMHSTDKTYFVWRDGEKFNYRELLQIEYGMHKQKMGKSSDITSLLENTVS